MTENKWSYAETNEWGDKCTEPNQSPINIDSSLTQNCKELCELEFMYQPSKCIVEFLKNQNMKIIYDSGSGVIFKKNYYKLIEITFHTPSLHKIDGLSADLEVCLVHSLTDQANEDNGVIVSCLYNSGKHYGNTEQFINQFINNVVVNSRKEIEVSKNWNADSLLPKYKSFFLYEGTMPYPPCTRSVDYIVMDTIGNIGPTNLELLKLNLGNNIRPLQLVGERKVFYNSGSNINTLDQRIEKISDDKFLRCKKNPVDDFKIKDKPVEAKKPQVQETSGFSESFKKNIKLVSTILLFILLVINAIFMVKYLFKTEYAQKMIIFIVGIGSYKKGNDKVYDNPKELLNDWRSKSQQMKGAGTTQPTPPANVQPINSKPSTDTKSSYQISF